MSSFKFGQKEIASKDFNKQRRVSDILTIDINKAVLSDKVTFNNVKDWWHIAGYQVEGETIKPLFSRHARNM